MWAVGSRQPLPQIKARILAALSLDARATFSEIANRLGLSRQQVKYHFDQLEAQHIIESCYAILNVVRLGYLYHRVLIRLANDHPLVTQKTDTWAGVHDLGDWAITLRLRAWVPTKEFVQVRADLTKGVKQMFDQEGIEIPYPHQVEYVREGFNLKPPSTVKKE